MAEQFLGTGINEQRRSGGRKKKQFLVSQVEKNSNVLLISLQSEETISPEDLENDSLTIEDGNMAASSSHEFGPPGRFFFQIQLSVSTVLRRHSYSKHS